MNNKTRKLKKNKKIKQKGGYIVPPTNPYFMATAALIGGLYVLGQAQSSKTDAEPTAAPSQPQGQSGGRKFRRTRKKKAGTIKEKAKKLGKGLYRASKEPYRRLHEGFLGTISDGEFDEREAKRQKLRLIQWAKEDKEKKEKQEVVKKKLEESLKKIEEKGLIRVKKGDELKKSKKYVQLNNHTTEGEFKELGEFRGLQRHYSPRAEDFNYPYSLYFEKDTIKKGSRASSAQELDLTYDGIYMYSDKVAFETGINTQLKLIDEKEKELAKTPQAKALERPEIRGEIMKFMRGGRKTRRRNKRKKGTRRRKQKGGDRELEDMVVELTLMFLPSRISMSNFNNKHDLKNEIIRKVKSTNDMGDLERGLQRLLALFLDRNENDNYEIDEYDTELKDQLKEILEVMCERPDFDCSNPLIQDILQ